MIEAFDIYIGRAEQGMWWRSAGAVEELSALRDWHRELVDVVVAADVPDGDARGGRSGLIALERDESAERCGQARDLVSWHDARARVSERLLGPTAQALLVRCAPGPRSCAVSERRSSTDSWRARAKRFCWPSTRSTT